MNAKFLDHIAEYRHTLHAHETLRIILNEKIKRQFHVIKEDHLPWIIPEQKDVSQYMLYEARAAHHYWNTWKKKFKNKVDFPGRKYQGKDPMNTLLNVGYHFLTQYLVKRCIALDIPTEIGILHRAQHSKSQPLIYDVMEWIRPTIDHFVYIYFSQKKHTVTTLAKYDIPKYINMIKDHFEKKYYHQKRKTCIPFSYWIDLYLLSFRSAVTHHTIAQFYFPPLRHDTRCHKKTLLH